MNTAQKTVLTQEGLDQLKKELDDLVNRSRPQAVKRVALAREQGDLSENSEYTAAREDLSFIDGRIIELEGIVHGAKIISANHSKSKVDLGCMVMIRINGKDEVFRIVGEWEADPKQKKISSSSPLGKALLGKRVGDMIEVEAPVGKTVYKIVKID